MNEDVLERVYQESLEERIISYLAETWQLSYEEAMRIYYTSKLANKIHNGDYGVQYLDYKVLVQILFETEPELFQECAALGHVANAKRVRETVDGADDAT